MYLDSSTESYFFKNRFYIIFQYFGKNMIAAAEDNTFKFDWIDGAFNESTLSSKSII